MKNLLSILSVALLLTGCGTTSPLSSQAGLNEALTKGSARLLIERDKSYMYSAGAATISVNGTEIASLGIGGGAVKDVKAGRIHLSVWSPGTFGRFSADFDAKAGKSYRLMVSPRDGQYWTGGFFGIIGDAVNAGVSEQSGYFQIEMVP